MPCFISSVSPSRISLVASSQKEFIKGKRVNDRDEEDYAKSNDKICFISYVNNKYVDVTACF